MPSIKRTASGLASIEIVPMFLAVGVSMIRPELLVCVPIIALLFLPVRWIAAGKPSHRTPADWGIAMILLMTPVTLWATSNGSETRLQVLRLLSGIALFYTIVNWCNSKNRLRMLLPGYALGGFILALIAPVSVRWSVNKISIVPDSLFNAFPALISDAIHPNVLAGVLVVILPVVCGMLLFSWTELSRFERTLCLLSAVSMCLVLVLTLSRGAWIAFGAVWVILPVLRWRRGWISLVIIGIISFILIMVFGIENLVQFLSSTGSIGRLDGRLEIWSRALYMLQSYPFTGIGMGSFGVVADNLYPLASFEPGSVPHVHNLFLQIAVDLGVPGLIGWLMAYFSIWGITWKLYRYGRTHRDRLAAGLGAGLFASQGALTVHGLFDAVTWGMVRPAPLIWAVWGLAAASWLVLDQICKEESQRVYDPGSE